MSQLSREVPHEVPVREPQTFPVHAGRRFIVTGAARGLGRAVAELLQRQGAKLALLDVLDAEVARTAEELGGQGAGVCALAADLTDYESLGPVAERAVELLGGIDGLANVAGASRHADPLAIPPDVWDFVLGVNLVGTHTLSQHVAASMRSSGVHGAIVNVASEAGKIGHPESPAYSASKAALINETRMLAELLAPYDINVNCVCPGGLPTEMLRGAARNYVKRYGGDVDEAFDAMARENQLGRAIQLSEVSRVISFLLSDEAVVIRGQSINVDAGRTPV